jgi:hypothetical protein
MGQRPAQKKSRVVAHILAKVDVQPEYVCSRKEPVMSTISYDTVPMSSPLCQAIKEYAEALNAHTSKLAFFNEQQYERILAAWRALDVIDPEGAKSVRKRMDAWIDAHYDWGYVYEYQGANAAEDRTLHVEGRTHEREFSWLAKREGLQEREWDWDEEHKLYVHEYSDYAWKWIGMQWVEYGYYDPTDSYETLEWLKRTW